MSGSGWQCDAATTTFFCVVNYCKTKYHCLKWPAAFNVIYQKTVSGIISCGVSSSREIGQQMPHIISHTKVTSDKNVFDKYIFYGKNLNAGHFEKTTNPSMGR